MTNTTAAVKPSAIRIERLGHSFERHKPVLHNLDISVAKGEILAILGPSGCGKTTLLRAASGLLVPTAGLVQLDGATPHLARSRGRIGFAFQSPTLLPWRTALENVMLPLELISNGQDSPLSHARQLLEQVGLAEAVTKLPRELSGGMQQRVGLARALSTRPDFLFLDEPFGALDGITRDRLNQQLHRLCRQYRLTTMIVTHSIEEAVFVADRVVVLTEAPAEVLKIIEIELGVERTYHTRALEAYFNYLKQIRAVLKEDNS